MEELPRQKLRELISKQGKGLCDDRRRCEALLLDVCGSYKREVNVIVAALQEGVPAELMNSTAGMPTEVVHARLAKRLQDNRSMADEAARWAIETWAFALGLPVVPLPAAAATPAVSTPLMPRSAPARSVPKTQAAPPKPQPKTPSASDHFNRGNDYAEKGDIDRAIAEYDQALKLDPRYAIAFYNRGVAYKTKGDIEHALRDYSEAIRLSPNYDVAYFGRGNIFLNKKEYARAITDYDQAIRLNPKDPNYYNNRGLAQVGNSAFDQAIKDYERALQIDPKYTKAASNLADAKKQGVVSGVIAILVVLALIVWAVKSCVMS